MAWWVYALASAFAAAFTAILAKIGVEGIPSNLATAVRTTIVVIFAWTIALAGGEQRNLSIVRGRPLLFLTLSGIGTGLSWLAYFRALQLAPASRVAPIDKLSLALTIVLAGLILGEHITWKVGLGATLMVIGALLTLAG
jgi:transporter family protein